MSVLLNFLNFTEEGLIKLGSVVSLRVLTCIDWGVRDSSMSRVSESDLIVPITHDVSVAEVFRLFSLALRVVLLPVEVVAVLHVMLVLTLGSVLHLSLTN